MFSLSYFHIYAFLHGLALSFSSCGDDRIDASGEVANQDIHLPGILPKVPGRFYYYFGKPIETEGMIIGWLMSLENYQVICDDNLLSKPTYINFVIT